MLIRRKFEVEGYQSGIAVGASGHDVNRRENTALPLPGDVDILPGTVIPALGPAGPGQRVA
jgi:hypothetical protein